MDEPLEEPKDELVVKEDMHMKKHDVKVKSKEFCGDNKTAWEDRKQRDTRTAAKRKEQRQEEQKNRKKRRKQNF
eukprot:10189044-Ditylum_brightwellii.AAC.1